MQTISSTRGAAPANPVKEGRNQHDAEEMSCTAHEQRHHEENGCLMISDEKLAKIAWIALGQRVGLAPVDYTFDIEVQAMSGEKLPFIVRAVVFTVAPRTDDDDDDEGLRYDDNLSQHFINDVVRGVIERETRALVASMTMEEIVRATSSSSINHQAVFEFENVQLELKHFDRLIVYDACVYVKPQSVDVSGNEDFSYVVAAEDDGEGHTGKVEEEVQSSSAEGGSNQEGRPSKMGQIMGWACQSLKPQILQIVYGNDNTTDGQLKQQIKLLSSYSLKALWFAMPMLYASLTHHSSTSTAFSVEDTLFLVAIIVDAALILLLSKWGNALVCISWLLLELATCLLILSFNKHYAFAILAVLLLAVVVALLQPKLQHAADRHVLPFFTQDMIGDDEESPHLDHLLDLSQGIASFGGLFTAIAGHFMVGPVNAIGFFFFCAIALGLYLSMVVTVGAVTRPHAKCLAVVVMVLVVLTFIAACIPFVGHSPGSKPQVVT